MPHSVASRATLSCQGQQAVGGPWSSYIRRLRAMGKIVYAVEGIITDRQLQDLAGD